MENQKKFVKFSIDYTDYETGLTTKFKKRKPYAAPDPKKVNAFIPGIVAGVFVKEGQTVKKGDPLFVLEAMKMKNSVTSPVSGKILKIYVFENKMVNKNETLLEFQ